MHDIRKDLQQEASFWQEMLKECPDASASDCQRMRDALMLAEFKLSQMADSYH